MTTKIIAICHLCSQNSKIKRVVIETTGVWCHDVTTLRRYIFLRYTMIKFAIHKSFFSKNTLVEYIGSVQTDTNNKHKSSVRLILSRRFQK